MRLLTILTFGVVVFISCNSERSKVNSDGLKVFAESIENDVRSGNKKSLLDKFNIDGFEDKCVAKVNAAKVKKPLRELRKEYARQIQTGVEFFFDDLIRGVREGGYFKFSKLYTENGAHHLIFSSYSWIGVNFFDFQITDSSNGPAIIDYYDFYTGEEYSETIFDHVMSDLRFGSLTGEYSHVMKKIGEVEHYNSNGEYQRAWEKINEVPSKFNSKTVQKLKLDLSKKISENAYAEALKDFIQKDSSDSRFRLYQQMNYYFLVKDYNKALDRIDALQSVTGSDLMFNLLRGDCYRGQANYKRAIEQYNRVISQYPALYHPYYYKFESLIKSGQSKEAEDFAGTIKREFKLQSVEMDSLYRKMERSVQ